MARWNRLEGVGLFRCDNCESFRRPAPTRPQDCAGQNIEPTARPCSLDRNHFGFFRPEIIPDASASVDFAACAQPDELLLLMYRVRRRLVDVLNRRLAELHPGIEAVDASGRRGLIVRVNSRWVYLVDHDSDWRVSVGLVKPMHPAT
jgi:hypothetical protein